jgi:hypothetical protein
MPATLPTKRNYMPTQGLAHNFAPMQRWLRPYFRVSIWIIQMSPLDAPDARMIWPGLIASRLFRGNHRKGRNGSSNR